MYNYLYRVTNQINGRFYVGVHRSKRRIDMSYLGSGKAIRQAVQKYGRENFKLEVLEYFDEHDDALWAEKEMITEEFLRDNPLCYNMKPGGRGGAHKGNQNAKGNRYSGRHSKKGRESIARAVSRRLKGKKQTEEHRANRCGKGMGENNGMASVEAREKVRLSKLGKKGLYKNGRRKMALPGSEKWKTLLESGYTPR